MTSEVAASENLTNEAMDISSRIVVSPYLGRDFAGIMVALAETNEAIRSVFRRLASVTSTRA